MSAYNIHAPQKSCLGCPFQGPKVGSKGDPTSNIVFVAESPGQEEKRQGQPLVGPSGKIFHEFVPEDVGYILNALECYPLAALKKDETRFNKGIACCRNRLLKQVQLHPRRIVVAMGNAALRSLTGDYKAKITQVRGRIIPSPLAEVGILPIVHIAALMRGGGSFRQWKQDINYALDIACGRDPIPYIPAKVVTIPDDAKQEYIDSLFRIMLQGSNELTGDIETTGFDHINNRILSLGITPANDQNTGYCFYPQHFPFIKSYLESPEISWCWHNGKFDVKFFHQLGIRARVDDDTMLLSYTLDEEGGVHDLETVAQDTIGAPDYKYMIKPYLPNKQASYECVPKEVLAEYQAIDTANTARLRPILHRRVRRDPALDKLYVRTLLPASAMLAWVEENGIYTDPQRIIDNEGFFLNMKAEVATEIEDLIGYTINPGSPKQVSELLFKKYKFPNRAKGSTGEDILVRLQKETEHPIFALILKHRKAVKMYGTYVKGLQKFIHQDTNRIHATYLIHGTRTGRLAARNPNLQNPPRLPQIRGTFMATPGYEIVEIDLSQAELRSLGACSGDKVLVEIYNSGGDIHTEMAKFLYPGWPDNRTKDTAKEERVKCKNVNFGIVYGISEFGLQGEIGGPIQESRRMIQGWYERFPEAAHFIKMCRNAPLKNQVITTCFGRKKRVGLVSRGNIGFLQNEAANFPHQSIASDITLHAAIRTWKQLRDWGVKIVNMVHDSIIMEVPITEGDELRMRVARLVAGELRQVPIDWGITAVPFLADMAYGERWGSLIEYKGEQGDLYG